MPASVAPQAGERLVFELIKFLAGKHELHLVVRIYEGQEAGVEVLKDYCRKVYPVFYKRPMRRDLFGAPRVVWSYYKLCRKANQLSAQEAFDVIHAEWTETGLFLKRRRARMVIEAHDVLSKPMERRARNAKGLDKLPSRVLAGLTRWLERCIFAKFDTVFVLSESDKEYVLSLVPLVNVTVLHYPAGLGFSDGRSSGKDPVLLFLGAMDRGPNVEAAIHFWNNILPLVRNAFPDVKFYIVGSRPLPEVRALAEKDPNTIVTGFVEDIESYYKTCTVFVAPLLTGGGIIVKILDALAAGTPVVTTTIGNEGIAATPGEHLLIGDTNAEFAAHVIQLLQNKPMCEEIGYAGKKFVAVKYNREALGKSLEAYYSAQ